MKDKTIKTVEEDHSISFLTPIIFLGLLFLPGGILGISFYYLFTRKLKWRPSVVFLPFLAGVLLFVISALIRSPFEDLFTWPLNLYHLYSYLWISLFFGWIGGYLVCLRFQNTLRRNPGLFKVSKGWKRDFKYKKGPFREKKEMNIINDLKQGKIKYDDRVPMGLLEEPILLENGEAYDKTHIVYRYNEEANKHTIITGSTGSGKSVNMLNFIHRGIKAGRISITLDMKKSQDYIYFLSKWAKEQGRPFYHFTSGRKGTYWNPFNDEQSSYDPLAFGKSSSKVDMILGLRKFTEVADVYKTMTMGLLQNLFFLLETADRDSTPQIPWDESGFHQFVAALEPKNFFVLLESYKKDIRLRTNISSTEKERLSSLEELYEIITNPKSSAIKDQLIQLRGIARNLIMSSYGEWLSNESSSKQINFQKVLADNSDKPPVILFSLSPLEEPEFAKYIGGLVVQDIGRAIGSAMNPEKGKFIELNIDEAQIIDIEKIKEILAKARGAGVCALLSYQSLEQIDDDTAIKSVTDTVDNFIIHSGASGDFAKRIAGIVGEYDKPVYTESTKTENTIFSFNLFNDINLRYNTSYIKDYLLPPDKIQELVSRSDPEQGYKSTCYYITKNTSEPKLKNISNRTISRKVNVIALEEIGRGIPEKFKIDYANHQRKMESLQTHKDRKIEYKNDHETERELLNDGIIKVERNSPLKINISPKRNPNASIQTSLNEAIRKKNEERRKLQ